jgi:hypothetical protein
MKNRHITRDRRPALALPLLLGTGASVNAGWWPRAGSRADARTAREREKSNGLPAAVLRRVAESAEQRDSACQSF